MAKAGYSAVTGAAVASGTAIKCVLSVIAPASFGVDLKKFRIALDGVTATNPPGLIQLYKFGTDGTGTAGTVNQVYGPTITPGFTTKYNYTANPTVLTEVDQWLLDPNKGLVVYDFPLGDTPDCAVSQGFGLFVTYSVTVNVRATMWVERT